MTNMEKSMLTIVSVVNGRWLMGLVCFVLLMLFLGAYTSSVRGFGSEAAIPSMNESGIRAGNLAYGEDAADPINGDDPVTVMFFGDSITAGYGLEEGQAFPSLISMKADSMGWSVDVIDAGVSGETTAGGLSRINWVLQREVDIFVLELGGNDGLRGINPDNIKENLHGILSTVRSVYPGAVILLTGMEAPPNMGEAYTSRFRQVYRDLADEHQVLFMPFILEGVAGNPALNQPDGIHPTAAGHRVIAENLWAILQPVLAKMHSAAE